jgi:hypothetical protein
MNATTCLVPYEPDLKPLLINEVIASRTPSEAKCLKDLENKGKKVYQRKENMRELTDVMTNPLFQAFFDKNFQSWDDIHTVTILMLALRCIDKYTEKKKLTKYQKLALLEMIMSDSEKRSLLFQHFTQDEKRPEKRLSLK